MFHSKVEKHIEKSVEHIIPENQSQIRTNDCYSHIGSWKTVWIFNSHRIYNSDWNSHYLINNEKCMISICVESSMSLK